ncbi:enoyl-CoA hydratase-related protein [Sinomonas sp. ASV322]|uniref:enoyl-CoA hydratase/isomerase family protein n=1 Tax=Sinomonas sp. ASV322 TaxID=3041920 RepID=UPI0027DD52F9|nr:enoyl-CoA hydratase-related protein [Sinomonas sp. ASV322]MDQ4504552.1 enoyl-CoA hydratase-related protein [Sinomonas sp. ASV322]
MDFGSYETLIVEASDGVATVTINRPEALNALSGQVVGELAKVCALFAGLGDARGAGAEGAGAGASRDTGGAGAEGAGGSRDTEGSGAEGAGASRDTGGIESTADDGAWPVRGVILTGAPGKAFVAGADIREMTSMSPDEAEAYARSMHSVTLALEALPVPVIACVDGYALGGGCELALAADFIYASESAQFGQPEVNLGLVPGFGGSVRLPQRVGLGMARELIYTARRLNAHEAYSLGLVNGVFSTREQLLETAAATIREIATKSPTAVAYAKRSINEAVGLPTAEGLEVEAKAFRAAFQTEDGREGTEAFLAKRPAAFPGR